MEKSRSAYLLLYEKVGAFPETAPTQPTPQTHLIQNSDAVPTAKVSPLPFLSLPVPSSAFAVIVLLFDERSKVGMPVDIYRNVWLENISFLKNKYVFDQDYFEFVVKVTIPPSFHVILLAYIRYFIIIAACSVRPRCARSDEWCSNINTIGNSICCGNPFQGKKKRDTCRLGELLE
jgi:hypothetical protein